MGFRSDQLAVWFMIILLYPRVSLSLPVNPEVVALLDFKRLINKDPLRALDSWNPSAHPNPCDGWVYVYCDDVNSGNVTAIALQQLGLVGKLSQLLGGLTSLESLVLYQNKIYGIIPPDFGKLTNLVSLDLSYNYLTGPIPAQLGKCKHLKSVNVSRNNLCGTIPPLYGSVTIYPGNSKMCTLFRCDTCRGKNCC